MSNRRTWADERLATAPAADLAEVPHQLRCLGIDLGAVIDAAASPSSPSPAPAGEPTAAPPATPRAA